MLYCIIAFCPLAVIGQSSFTITPTATPNSFPIVTDTAIAPIYYDKADARVVEICAKALQQDIHDITGRTLTTFTEQYRHSPYTIVVGTIGHCNWIDELIQKKLIDVDNIKNKWESFSIQLVNYPGKGINRLLVVAGSDRRGTAYGILHLSRTMGVSPFVWWADTKPAKQNTLFAKGSYTSTVPSVKYRGIFINDEDWGLQPWAATHLDKDIKDIGPYTYAKVFELMLRLKANYIWPAMHPCTKAFYYYKDNPKVADEYAIIVGGSHCEPMLRNNVFEWAENFEHEYGKKPGDWRYDLNKDEMYKYWDDRVKEAVKYESVYTVGMRGIHDGSMPGPKDPVEKLRLLEKVITDQRAILKTNFGKSASDVPQIFVPYKEVLSLYRRGLQLADDVTIIWPDDNHGYIRQLPNEQERKRSGGHGVYYHLSYWGAPHDYLWLSSISPSLISYEMNKAYNYGADRLWVFNVGDIKPAELELQFAMDMAWDITQWTPDKAYTYTYTWAKEIFGEKLAGEISTIKDEYYHLAASGKPEHMGAIDFSFWRSEDRMREYDILSAKAQALKLFIPTELQDAYYQLVLYPVMASKLMNEKILFAKGSFFGLFRAARFVKLYKDILAKNAFDSIQYITNIYNKEIAGGKWDGIMSWHPRDLPVFKMPITKDSVPEAKRDSIKATYFKLPEPEKIIDASEYNHKKTVASWTIETIQGLGIGGKGITATSHTIKDFPVTDLMYVDYTFPAWEGNYTIIVKCLPSFDVIASKNLRYAIAVNGEPPQIINVHAEADSKEWRENVLRGFSQGKTTHTIPESKTNKLRIWFKDPNLVINTIEFYKQ
jgi:hypothetical protein